MLYYSRTVEHLDCHIYTSLVALSREVGFKVVLRKCFTQKIVNVFRL